MQWKSQPGLFFVGLVLLAGLSLHLASCGSGGQPSPTGSDNSASLETQEPEDPALLEASNILPDPLAEPILQTMFNPERDLATNGAVGPNQVGYRNIRPQGDGAFLALALGMARSDENLIERGVRALEFGLPHQNPDGSFDQSAEQDIARFALFGLRSHSMLANSPYAGQYAARLETIFDALLRSNELLHELLPKHPEVYETTNQVAMLAYVFLISGERADNNVLITRGDELLQWVLSVQREDGAFPEYSGHDSHYQAVSMMALANIYLHSEQTFYREAVYPALQAGFEWEKTRISSSGQIDDEGNTRAANDPSDSPEGKQINPREVALTLLYLSYLGPEFAEALDLSEAVLENFL